MPKTKSLNEEIVESNSEADEAERIYCLQMTLARKKDLRDQGLLFEGVEALDIEDAR